MKTDRNTAPEGSAGVVSSAGRAVTMFERRFKSRASGAISTKQSLVMTLTQAAAYLSVSKAHLSNVINGKVPDVPVLLHARIGRRILIRREWADEWLEAAAQKSFLTNGII